MNRTFFIAGGQYHKLPKIIREIKPKILLELQPEPENKFDPNAVRILMGDDFLGYVPKKFSSEVSAMLEMGVYLECEIEEVNPSAKPWEMCKVTIREVDEAEKVERGMYDDVKEAKDEARLL